MGTDEEFLRKLRHPSLVWNTPLSSSHADRLLSALAPSRGSRIVDLGCGWGELLLRAVAQTEEATGIGVDQNLESIARGENRAHELGLSGRVRFIAGDAVGLREPGDIVICVGADHAWGGVQAALLHLRSMVRESGRLLFGSGFWNQVASPEMLEIFGALPASFESVLTLAAASGWRVIMADSATLSEWDDFETTWRLDLEKTAALEPASEEGGQARRLGAQRREEYEHGYRDVLGFAYLVLE